MSPRSATIVGLLALAGSLGWAPARAPALPAYARLAQPADPAPAPPAQPAQTTHRARGLLGVPTGVTVDRNIVYATVGDRKLLLDVYLPDAGAAADDGKDAKDPKKAAAAKPALLPVIIWIHGGGWEMGTKDGCPAAALVPHGYAAVSISYRFSQVAPYPAQIHDCKGAVRWVRAHAKEYGLDPDRIGVWGASAGGHLVALLGTSAGVKELEGDTGGNLDQSSRVQAVCDWFGPTDIIRLCRMDLPDGAGEGLHPATPEKKPARAQHSTPRVIAKLLGGELPEKNDVARSASPIAFVDKSDAPFLIMHGDADTLVPLEQSQLLEKALKDASVPAELHVVKGGGHGFWNQELLDRVRGFFDERLKSPAPTTR